MSQEQPRLDGTWEVKDNTTPFCPLQVSGWTHGPDVTDVRQAPCDPINCKLGTSPAGTCSLLDIALISLQLIKLNQVLDKISLDLDLIRQHGINQA